MNLFLDGIFDKSSTSPNKITLSFTEWKGSENRKRVLYGLLASEPTVSTRNKWGPILDNLGNLADLTSMMGSQSVVSWIGASVMCWKGTDPLRMSLDFYLINYKRTGLNLEEKLESLTKLTSLSQVSKDSISKFTVAVHGGYAPSSILTDNQSMFANNGYVQRENTGIDLIDSAINEAENFIYEKGFEFPQLNGSEPGVISVKIGNKMAVTNMLASGIDVTPSMAEVAKGKALFYRVNLSLIGARPLLATDIDGMYGG